MTIEVDAQLTLIQAHELAEQVRHKLFHEIPGVSEVLIHTDPSSKSGNHHQSMEHHLQAAQRPVVQR
jgi:divalent metal cation (Fe/Co/Zn/Cd) transporter